MQRIDLDQLHDSCVQYKQSQEYKDYYRVECVRNIEIDIVLKILRFVDSRTRRIDSRDLSIFHFLFPFLIGGASLSDGATSGSRCAYISEFETEQGSVTPWFPL
jgi:hypothetical protein